MKAKNFINSSLNKRPKVLICGCKGQLGEALSKTKNKKFKVFTTSKENLDITDYKKCKKKIFDIKPDYIINAAAYTNVDLAEKHLKEAKRINVIGPKNLAKIAKQLNSCLIHISTDYVFDGKKKSNYLETDKANPLSIYGKTKLMGECEIIKNLKKHIIIRVSWLYSPNHKNFVTAILEAGMNQRCLKIVEDQYGMPTYSYDLSQTIWSIIEKINNNFSNYGIYHFSSYGRGISRYEFSKAVFKYASKFGYKAPKIISKKFYSLDNSKIRPKFSCLNINKILKTFSLEKVNWRNSLLNMIKIYFSKNIKKI